MAKITVHYYALLREKAGKSSEEIFLNNQTSLEIYRQLSKRYGFDQEIGDIQVAVNDAFSDWDTALKDGDELVFITPVSGG